MAIYEKDDTFPYARIRGGGNALEIAAVLAHKVRLQAFKEALSNGGNVTLTGDISPAETLEIGNNAKINLNGHTIKSDAETALKFTGGTSTIGGGIVIGASGKTATTIRVEKGAEITIEGGTYSVGTDENGEGNTCIYSTGGTISITGGTFSSDGLFKGHHWVLNKKDGTDGAIKVTGGRFKDFDPANPETDDDDSYVETGYESVKDEDYYEVRQAEEE